MAQQEFPQPVARTSEVFHHVASGAAKIPDGLLLDGWDADADQLAGAVQPGQPPAIPPVGLDLVARRLGDQRRGDHLAAHVQAVQQPGQLEAGRSGLVAGSQAAGLPRRPTSLRMDASSWGIRSTSGTCWSAGKIPTEMVSLWTSRPRWIGVRCETLGTAGSFRMVAPPTPVWVTHADADRSRPFHAGYGSGGWGFESLAARSDRSASAASLYGQDRPRCGCWQVSPRRCPRSRSRDARR